VIEQHANHALVSAVGSLGGKRTEFILCTSCRVVVSEIRLAHQPAVPAIPTTQEGNPDAIR
jgi:hypothetical protein